MASGDIPPASQGATASEQEGSLVSGLKESHRWRHMHFCTIRSVSIQAESPKEVFPAQALCVLG